MAIKKRESLKQSFATGNILTQKDFCDLLDSVLNRREDRFYGLWQPGVAYRPGDVVLYGADTCETKLYVLQVAEHSTADSPKDETYCKATFDTDRWHIMELHLEDDDWHVIQDGVEAPAILEGDHIMYAKVYGKVGIGTQCPEARLDVKTDSIGQLQIDPDGQADPTLTIHKLTPEASSSFAMASGAQHASLWTDAPMGFILKHAIPAGSGADAPSEEKLLVLSLVDPMTGRVKLGVNTGAPKAMLDILEEKVGEWMALPDGSEYPEVVLVNLSDACDTNFYSARLEEKRTVFHTDAPDGFLFKKGEDWALYSGDEDASKRESLLTIQPGPKVGIGTEDPEAALEVTDGVAGRLLFDPKSPQNPALSIINTRKGDNYLTLGADNDNAILQTDSAHGFIFKAGGELSSKTPHPNLTHGEQLARLTKNGELGIGTEDPDGYQLDIHGKAQAFGFYIPADDKRITEVDKLTEVLPGICDISPIKFTWKEKTTNCADEGEQIGLWATEVDDSFPECVRKVGTKSSIAYPNLVAVLLQGIKEQQAQINSLQETISTLDERLCALEDNQATAD